MEILTVIPIPRDIPLPLPLPEWLLAGLLVFSFLLHILFVNLMVGGTFLTLWAEIKGIKNESYLTLAKEISKTITVNKSLAVVLGVAPLLSINALYTLYFYSANALTGNVWITIVPVVTLAFLIIYLHKYTWDRIKNRKLHISLIAIASVLFLFVPLIFLTNINLMLFPEKWGTVHGFFSAMTLSNVFPRYLHFLCASFAITGMFLFGYMRRRKYPFAEIFPDFTRSGILRKWYRLALYASMIQALLGLLVYFTLPKDGLSMELVNLIVVAAVIAIISMLLIWVDLRGSDEKLGRHFFKVVVGLTITVTFMGTIRHVYRAVALAPHQKLAAAKTAKFIQRSAEAKAEALKKANTQALNIKLKSSPDKAEKVKIAAVLGDMQEIRYLKFNDEQNTLELTFDGTRITSDEILARLRNSGLPLQDE